MLSMFLLMCSAARAISLSAASVSTRSTPSAASKLCSQQASSEQPAGAPERVGSTPSNQALSETFPPLECAHLWAAHCLWPGLH